MDAHPPAHLVGVPGVLWDFVGWDLLDLHEGRFSGKTLKREVVVFYLLLEGQDGSMDMANEWIETARSDLEVAKILYEKQHYPQAVFHFQQSVEKAIKGLSLFSGKTEKEVENYVHDPTKFYDEILKEVLKDKKILDSIKELKKQGVIEEERVIEEELSHIPQRFREYKKERKSRMSSKGIKSMIKEITEEKKQIKTEVVETTRQIMFEFSRKAEEEKQKLDGPTLKKLYKIFKVTCDFTINLGFVSWSLLYTAIITAGHVAATRYPKNNSTPRKIYTKKLPIVKMLPKLMLLHEDALKILESLVNFKSIKALGNIR